VRHRDINLFKILIGVVLVVSSSMNDHKERWKRIDEYNYIFNVMYQYVVEKKNVSILDNSKHYR
jgi:hypothetical protein